MHCQLKSNSNNTNDPTNNDQLPKVIIIDNDQFYLHLFKFELAGKANILTFLGPNDFEVFASKADVESANLIIVDFKYPFGNAIESALPEYIREDMGYKGKLVLYSHMDDFGVYNRKVKEKFDGVIHKKDICWEAVNMHL